jgi:segregation and condensation protein B
MGTEEGQERRGDLVLRIEALLFAAGKPLTVHDLSDAVGTKDWTEVQRALKKMQHNYASRLTALELRRAGDGWAIQVRKEFAAFANRVAAPEISRRALKTLALIAYHQPIRQSRLVKMVGDKVYGDIPTLRELGFVRAAEKANTLELSTTSKFAEYFGFESTDRKKLRQLMEKGLGIVRPDPPEPAGEDPSPEEPQPAPAQG